MIEEQTSEFEEQTSEFTEQRKKRLINFGESDVYKLDIEPKFIEMLTGIESLSDSTTKPTECFALRRAYYYLSELKVWLDTPY